MVERLREIKPGYYAISRSADDKKHLEETRQRFLSPNSACSPTRKMNGTKVNDPKKNP